MDLEHFRLHQKGREGVEGAVQEKFREQEVPVLRKVPVSREPAASQGPDFPEPVASSARVVQEPGGMTEQAREQGRVRLLVLSLILPVLLTHPQSKQAERPALVPQETVKALPEQEPRQAASRLASRPAVRRQARHRSSHQPAVPMELPEQELQELLLQQAVHLFAGRALRYHNQHKHFFRLHLIALYRILDNSLFPPISPKSDGGEILFIFFYYDRKKNICHFLLPADKQDLP
jgi:hypothetical protein